jgi:hypothetical protein
MQDGIIIMDYNNVRDSEINFGGSSGKGSQLCIPKMSSVVSTDVLKAKGLTDNEAAAYLTTVLNSLENMRNGDNVAEEGNHDMAIAEYNKSLIIEQIPQGKHHPDTGDIYGKDWK